MIVQLITNSFGKSSTNQHAGTMPTRRPHKRGLIYMAPQDEAGISGATNKKYNVGYPTVGKGGGSCSVKYVNEARKYMKIPT